MKIIPLVSLINKNGDYKSIAIIEGLIFVPLSAFLLSYALSKTDFTFEFRMSVVSVIGIILTGIYARYASS